MSETKPFLIHRTVVVPATQVELARSLCAALAGPPGEGMFTTALSETGKAPATYYISSGWISSEFAGALSNPKILTAICAQQDPPIKLTEVQATGLLSVSKVSDGTVLDEEGRTVQEDVHTFIARIGLKLVAYEI